MQDTELYRHLLGIEKPWTVARVELAVKEQRVDVFVEHKPGEEFPCPECDQKLGVYDHAEERTWRHLDSCHFATLLRARILLCHSIALSGAGGDGRRAPRRQEDNDERSSNW